MRLAQACLRCQNGTGFNPALAAGRKHNFKAAGLLRGVVQIAFCCKGVPLRLGENNGWERQQSYSRR